MSKEKTKARWLFFGKDKYTYDTIDELVNKSMGLAVGEVVTLNGYYSADDGATHKRVIADTDDGSGVQLRSGKWANIVYNTFEDKRLTTKMKTVIGAINELNTEMISEEKIQNNSISSKKLKIATDEDKIKLANLSDEVKKAMAGNTPVSPTLQKDSIVREYITDKAVDRNKIDDSVFDYEKELGEYLSNAEATLNRIIKRKNLADQNKFTINHFMNTKGEISLNEKYFHTGKIRVKQGEIYSFIRSRFVTAFKNGVVSEKDGIDSENIYSYTVPSGVTEIVLTSYTNEKNTFIINEGDKRLEEYISYDNLFFTDEALKKIKSNILYGKKIYNFGDSIAAGDGNNGVGYAELLKEYGAIVTDYAVGGSTLSRIPEQSMESILTHIENAPSALPDVILLEGGSNDYTQSRKIGEMTQYRYLEITQWEYDEKTYLGALEKAFYMLNKKYPGVPVIWVYSHQQSSRDKKIENGIEYNYYTMHDKSLEVCRKWAKPICDVFVEGNLNTCISYHKSNYTNNSDGTHPNELGYKKFYVPLLKSVIEKIIN